LSSSHQFRDLKTLEYFAKLLKEWNGRKQLRPCFWQLLPLQVCLLRLLFPGVFSLEGWLDGMALFLVDYVKIAAYSFPSDVICPAAAHCRF